jgi:hypothetical protein
MSYHSCTYIVCGTYSHSEVSSFVLCLIDCLCACFICGTLHVLLVLGAELTMHDTQYPELVESYEESSSAICLIIIFRTTE